MTRDFDKSILPAEQEEFLTLAQKVLTVPDYNLMKTYMEQGGYPLAPETSAAFFELFLRGNSCSEIHRLNKAFKYGAILHARIKYGWDKLKDEMAQEMMAKVREKVAVAQIEAVELVTDLIAVAKKTSSDKLKKFLQTGNEADLDGAMSIDSINSLLKVSENLLKLSGQDRKTESKTTHNLNVNVNNPASPEVASTDLSPDSAAQILKILADDKRKKEQK